jgi:hypothetical protein
VRGKGKKRKVSGARRTGRETRQAERKKGKGKCAMLKADEMVTEQESQSMCP